VNTLPPADSASEGDRRTASTTPTMTTTATAARTNQVAVRRIVRRHYAAPGVLRNRSTSSLPPERPSDDGAEELVGESYEAGKLIDARTPSTSCSSGSLENARRMTSVVSPRATSMRFGSPASISPPIV